MRRVRTTRSPTLDVKAASLLEVNENKNRGRRWRTMTHPDPATSASDFDSPPHRAMTMIDRALGKEGQGQLCPASEAGSVCS